MGEVYHIWGQPKKKLSARELIAKHVNESACMLVELRDKVGQLEAVHIELHGTAARIPAMKNSKLPGKNFINPEFLARIKGMDVLFNHAAKKQGIESLTFGHEPVICAVICGHRPRDFDALNVAETVADWLEPACKPVGRAKAKRGWGIGLIENDSQITMLSTKACHLYLQCEYTRIVVRRAATIGESLAQFVASIFTGAR